MGFRKANCTHLDVLSIIVFVTTEPVGGQRHVRVRRRSGGVGQVNRLAAKATELGPFHGPPQDWDLMALGNSLMDNNKAS